MLTTHAVGIDLGTTYSCIAYLNEQGEPVSIANEEGEISTPSVVLFDAGEEIVGTEALRNAIIHPDKVVQNAKRSIGDSSVKWEIEGHTYTPVDISACVLRKLLRDAQNRIGPIERAVITVPAQFSDVQRQATVEAGMKAGLKQVDIINEPVAAALCYVLGSEGLWFTELATEQRILVYDLGGGTFDLSLVSYKPNEVRVIASSGDLHLGGIDWNQKLLDAIAEQFEREFGPDPRDDPESKQHLWWEVEQCKRSLTVRPRAALICQHAGQRKTYQVQQEQFNRLTKPLVDKSERITQKLLKDHKMGWAHVDVVLSMGGSSRMPMIRETLKRMSGRTLNTSLSPDQSIAHGATYYAGMLLSNDGFARSILSSDASARLSQIRQQSVNARALGILVRDPKTNTRVPHYLIPASTALPTEVTQVFGTVGPNQRRVHLHVVESGAGEDRPCVELGTCEVNGLPPDLPVDSQVEVTIRYDSSARVHVSARDVTSGRQAATEIIRKENLLTRPLDGGAPEEDDAEIVLKPVDEARQPSAPPARLPLMPAAQAAQAASRSSAAQPASAIQAAPVTSRSPATKSTPGGNGPAAGTAVLGNRTGTAPASDSSPVPVALCEVCGGPLNAKRECAACLAKKRAGERTLISKKSAAPAAKTPPSAKAAPLGKPKLPSVKPIPTSGAPGPPRPGVGATPKPAKGRDEHALSTPSEHEIMELPVKKGSTPPPSKPKSGKGRDEGEDEFWKLAEE